MGKVSVKVETEINTDGKLVPKAVIWNDGRKFRVSRVLYQSKSPTREYDGIRYTVIIGNSERYIYKVNKDWYVIA